MDDYGALKLQLKNSLSQQLFTHSVNTARTAMALARRYESDPSQAYLAGLLHDCAKECAPQYLLQTAIAFGIVRDDSEKRHPDLLHDRVGALLAWKKYGIQDKEVLTAIAVHTLGAETMGLLDKIVYIADLIEPGRDFPAVGGLRALAHQDLDRAVLIAMDNTISRVLQRGLFLHPQTVQARNSLLLTATASTWERGENGPDKKEGYSEA
ncbi:MAG: HD domain-containing protein [Firmicutes bacterium]|nr:HD domain-containing protein [Bacillota bacterium]